MKGLELAQRYYETYGKKMLEEKFPELCGRVAAGLAGYGSECLGFDDGISADHDYGPSFCLWLTEEDYKAYGQALQREYDGLPAVFEGVAARKTSAHGGGRVGVLCIPDFYYALTGFTEAPERLSDWMRIPEEGPLPAAGRSAGDSGGLSLRAGTSSYGLERPGIHGAVLPPDQGEGNLDRGGRHPEKILL